MAEEDTVETEGYDWDHIRQLIDIVDMLRGHPNLKAISDAAMAELNTIANPPEEEEPAEEPTEEVEDEKEPKDV